MGKKRSGRRGGGGGIPFYRVGIDDWCRLQIWWLVRWRSKWSEGWSDRRQLPAWEKRVGRGRDQDLMRKIIKIISGQTREPLALVGKAIQPCPLPTILTWRWLQSPDIVLEILFRSASESWRRCCRDKNGKSISFTTNISQSYYDYKNSLHIKMQYFLGWSKNKANGLPSWKRTITSMQKRWKNTKTNNFAKHSDKGCDDQNPK